jgi:hypothetical protein
MKRTYKFYPNVGVIQVWESGRYKVGMVVVGVIPVPEGIVALLVQRATSKRPMVREAILFSPYNKMNVLRCLAEARAREDWRELQEIFRDGFKQDRTTGGDLSEDPEGPVQGLVRVE